MNKKRLLQAVAVVAASVALIAGAASSSASAVNADGARATAVTYAPLPLPTNSVGAGQISPNAVGWEELGTYPRQTIRLLQGPIIGNQRIAPGTVFMDQLATSARKQEMATAQLAEPKLVTNVGGPINTQGTKLGLGLQLKHGSYLVTVSGQINRTTTAATPGKQTQPQLSLWLDRNRDGEFTWQTEGSISPNGTIPDLAGRSVTVSGTTVLTINQSTPMDIDLVAHGYNNDQSGVGSGELTVVNAVISAIPIAS